MYTLSVRWTACYAIVCVILMSTCMHAQSSFFSHHPLLSFTPLSSPFFTSHYVLLSYFPLSPLPLSLSLSPPPPPPPPPLCLLSLPALSSLPPPFPHSLSLLFQFLRKLGQEDILYKPVQPGIKGAIEVQFYENLFRGEELSNEILALRELVPGYHHMETIRDRAGNLRILTSNSYHW